MYYAYKAKFLYIYIYIILQYSLLRLGLTVICYREPECGIVTVTTIYYYTRYLSQDTINKTPYITIHRDYYNKIKFRA